MTTESWKESDYLGEEACVGCYFYNSCNRETECIEEEYNNLGR